MRKFETLGAVFLFTVAIAWLTFIAPEAVYCFGLLPTVLSAASLLAAAWSVSHFLRR